MGLRLVIGNKNYSSWSMRPWVLMRQAGIPFDEELLRFDAFTPGSQFKQRMGALSAAGKVPVLIDNSPAGGGDGLVVWDSLAIAEYLAERFPERALWPADAVARARARSACAEMHAGFGALRSHCPMNIEARLPEVGERLWAEQPALRADVARVVALWGELLAAHDGPLLCGAFSIADAFFAPVCTRIQTYALPVPADIGAYCDRVLALPGVVDWVAGALAEQDFLAFGEPYRSAR